MIVRRIWLNICVLLCTAALPAAGITQQADNGRFEALRQTLQRQIAPLLGERDAALVAAPSGTILLSVHPDLALVPASILKILTSLAAIEILGADYRFPTEFYVSQTNDLKIKGYGDPMQVSEQLMDITRQLSEKLELIADIILDDSFFAKPIAIPGKGRSPEPYDAPNGALCVNFNTVSFTRRNGDWISAEPQTPLLPLVIEKIEKSGLQEGRITLAADSGDGLRYAGELYRYFLSQAGLPITGKVSTGTVAAAADQLLWRYQSPHVLSQVIQNLLEFSNNFIANQLLLVLGAHVYGPPATMEKGLQAMHHYITANLNLPAARFVEASGISRDNAITARSMVAILNRFYPYRSMLRSLGCQWYKTGTLSGIHTRAGYLSGADGQDYRFVIMLNTSGKNTDRCMGILEKTLCR